MFEHLPEIAAVDPPAAGRATDEMLGLVLGWIADAFHAESFLRRQFVDQRWPDDLNDGAPLIGNLHDYLSVDDVAMNLLQFRRRHQPPSDKQAS